MDKKRFSYYLLSVCALLIIGVETASAEDFPDGWFIGEHNWRWRVNKTTRHAQLILIPNSYDETIVSIPETVTDYDDIVYTVTSIQADALHNNLEEITIPSGVTVLEPKLFYCFLKLKRVNLPTTLKSIGNEAFKYCTIPEIALPEGLECIGNEAFTGCNYLTEIVLPSSITSIGVGCFSNCDMLRDVIIQCPLKTLPQEMFSSCKLLSSVTLPEGMEEIGRNAFGYCESLTALSCPQSLRKLEADAFYGCNSIVSLDWGPNITEIGEDCFWDCKMLRSISMPGVRTIRNNAFAGCLNLSHASMPVVESIEFGAFMNCMSLRKVTLPNTLRTLESDAFQNCKSLTSIDLAQVGNIGMSVFDGCDNLKEVTIRRSAESYYSILDPFMGCTSIRKLTIGPDVTTLDGFDFEDCDQLMIIDCQGTTPPDGEYSDYGFGSKTFSRNTFDKAALIVPEEAEAAYRAHKLWKNFFPDVLPVLEASYMGVITGIFNQNWVVRTMNVFGEMETPYVSVSGSNWNHSQEGVTSAYGIGLYDKDMNLVQEVSFREPLYFVPGEAKAIHSQEQVGKGIPDGEYMLAPFCGDPQKGTHCISWNWEEDEHHVPVYIHEDTIAFYEPLYDDFIITRGEMVYDNPQVGQTQLYSINYAQRGNRPYRGYLYCMINGECVDSMKIDLPAHGHWFGRFIFTPTIPGKKILKITTDKKGLYVKFSDTFIVSGGGAMPQECSLTLLYPETGSITLPVEDGQQLKLTITAEEGWEINSVYFDGTDITADMDNRGRITTPPISMKSKMSVVYEQLSTNAIETVSQRPEPSFLLNGNTASIGNARPGTAVRVYSLSGQLMKTVRVDAEGNAVFILPSGKLYIINCGTKRFKIRL